MIKATLICGGSAVREYDETGKIPSTKWLNAHGGAVDVREFRTVGEYKAYSMGLADSDGWQAVVLTGKVFTKRNDASTDCKHCKEWRAIFCDREHDVYCPDCGKLILHPEEEGHEGEQE